MGEDTGAFSKEGFVSSNSSNSSASPVVLALSESSSALAATIYEHSGYGGAYRDPCSLGGHGGLQQRGLRQQQQQQQQQHGIQPLGRAKGGFPHMGCGLPCRAEARDASAKRFVASW